MRNKWFPTGVAEYVTMPELKKLRLSNAAFSVERDFQFTLKKPEYEPKTSKIAETIDTRLNPDEIVSASAFQKKVEVEKLTPERSVELLDFFLGPQLDFYRQPIIEEKEAEEEEVPEEPLPKKKEIPQYGGGAATELLAARMDKSPVAKIVEKIVEKPQMQAIYGSVSSLDVLQAVRAALAEDDEAKRVVLSEDDIQFVDLPETEGETTRVVKHVGDFAFEINVRGAETPVRRLVSVIPQELER